MKGQTALSLKLGSKLLIKLFCRGRFVLEGEKNIPKARRGDTKDNFIITSSHFCNLDSLAAIRTFGKRFDLHFAIESVLLRSIPHLIVFLLAGIRNFSPLSYSRRNKVGVFNPQDFERLTKQMEKGKTPWIVIHPFTTDGEMKRASIGPIYLAQKSNARIIPTALEARGATISLETMSDYIKGLFCGGMTLNYRIGKTIKLAPINISIIESVFQKRTNGQAITLEERKTLKEVHIELKQQADYVARIIASMLPDEQKGIYK